MPQPIDIVTFNEPPVPEGQSPYVPGAGPSLNFDMVDWSDAWPGQFQLLAKQIEDALGWRALVIEHVGSTSVPGLPAKPIIDIDLIVADPNDEASYVPALDVPVSNCGFGNLGGLDIVSCAAGSRLAICTFLALTVPR